VLLRRPTNGWSGMSAVARCPATRMPRMPSRPHSLCSPARRLPSASQDSLAQLLHGVAHRVALRGPARRGPAASPRPTGKSHGTNQSTRIGKDRSDLQAALTAEVDACRRNTRRHSCFATWKQEHAEAAQQLGWKAGTVSAGLAQARKLLEKGLARSRPARQRC